jgi:hypothetical protein
LLREQAARSVTASHQKEFPEDFVYDFVEPGAGDSFEFGINYKACGFCKFAARHGDKDILPNICGLDFDAYAARGIRRGTDADIGWRREPLQFPVLAAPVGLGRRPALRVVSVVPPCDPMEHASSRCRS